MPERISAKPIYGVATTTADKSELRFSVKLTI
jgi:hypothetical protein